MEVIIHGFLSALTALCAQNKFLFRKIKYFIFGFVLISVFFYRMAGADEDIKVYLVTADYGFSFNFYFLREPFVWYSLIGLNNFLDNPVWSLLVLDMVTLGSLFLTLNRVDYGIPLLLIWCTSFIFLLGVQNVYRQYVSMTFILCSLVFISENERKRGLLFFILAIAAHNAALFVLPVCTYRFAKRYKTLYSVFAIVLITILMQLTSSQKSVSSTGINAGFLYISVFLFLLSLFILVCNKLHIRPDHFAIFFLIPLLMMYLGSAQFERALMYFLLILIFDLVHHDYRRRSNFTLIYLLLFIIFVPAIYAFGTRFIMFT
jgi:hypothetical protein